MPQVTWDNQVRNKVRWRPGQEANLAPHVRTWGLSEANVLHWRKYLWQCWDFSAPPPRSDSAPGELCTPCSLVMPLGTTHHRRERNIPGFSKISQISFSVLMFARRRWQASFWSIKCSKVFSKFTSTSSAFLLLCRKMFNIIETAPKYLQRSWRSLHTLKKQSLLDAVCVQPWLTTVWIRTWMH